MNPSNDNLVIDTHSLTKHFKGVQALTSLNLQVPQHSIFGFLGPNGAGKTTTIKLLLGLARPTSGSGKIFGYDIVKDSVKIRSKVGYLAQDPRYYEYMTARETMRFTAGFFFKGPRQKIEERIEETLELVGLTDKADRSIKGFSGGERQRLGIAQAQVNYPDLLILDEPAASLDPMGRHDVLDVMERLRKYTTIFYSTHILDDVQRVSDTVCILNRGKLVALAPIEQLMAGSGEIIYELNTQGEVNQVKALVAEQPWVKYVKVANVNGHQAWEISIVDESMDEQLLRLVMSVPSVHVKGFTRRQHDLEDVFMDIVIGVEQGKK
jgi:ABC-2 type transport system ATP-binding protein